MSHHDIITIGASAGGIRALQRLLGMLPPDLDAAVFIVQHRHPEMPSRLTDILQRATGLTVVAPEDRQRWTHGHVYVAPPDRHLLLDGARLRVVHGPRENRHRPAIDPLFRSAAWSFGPRVVALVLTGTMTDGAAGLWAVKSCGGVTMVQDPADAAYADMPAAALASQDVDYRVALDDLGPLLAGMVRKPASGSAHEPPAGMRQEIDIAMAERHADVEDMDALGQPSGFTCPSCHGALWELAIEPGGKAVVLRVRDDGQGMETATLPLVFDMFVQGDRTIERMHGGLGIGLTLVRKLVELHGGTIEARSDGLGQGSAFTVRLPVGDLASTRPLQPDGAGAPPPPRRILVVDDNVDAAETVRILLRQAGHSVEIANSGPAGLEAIRTFKPDVVLLDLGMPGMSGYEVARQLRSDDGKDVLLIAVTGYSSEDMRERAREAGFDQYLVKPFDLADLQALFHPGR